MATDSDNGASSAAPPASRWLQPELVALFDELVNVMFCAKDLDGRYVAVNPAFVRRSGRRSPRDVIGRRATDLFPPLLGERYEEQDARVLTTGRPLRDELELIRRPDHQHGWYLTTKTPVRHEGRIVGLVSISRDLETPTDDDLDQREPHDPTIASLARVVEFVGARLDEPLRVADLAAAAGCSDAQLDRRMRRVFGLSPNQYVLRVRVDRARLLLSATELPIATIAAQVGFYDQASFTHRFGRLTGQTPAQFRATTALH